MSFSGFLNCLVPVDLLFFVDVLICDRVGEELLYARSAADFLRDGSCPAVADVLSKLEHHLGELLGSVRGRSRGV